MYTGVIGAVLIAAVSVYTGGAFIALWKRRLDGLGAFCTLAGALHDGIAVMGLAVDEIVLRISDPFLEQSGFLPSVREGYRAGEEHVLCRALDAAAGYWMPEDGEYRLLYEFFASVGCEDRIREGERCAYVMSRLRAMLDLAEKAHPSRCRIAKTLAGAVGGAAVLLLL